MRNDVVNISEKIVEKFRRSARLAAAEGILPYKSENGHWVTSPYDGNSWWTGGFWPGLMWQLYAMTKDEQFKQEARRTEDMLTAELRTFNYLNHDVGFMYLLSCGAGRHTNITYDRLAYSPLAFEGGRHLITVRAMTQPELTTRRNVACNPADLRGDTDFYPIVPPTWRPGARAASRRGA